MIKLTLAAARVNAGLKQEQAAKLIGVTPKTLGSYERGNTAIPGYRLKRAAEVYGIPEDMIKLPVVDDGEYDEDEKNLQVSTF
ncbi:helix-turn-helix transcriptional regulator [Shouchella clausii]|uniref:helix-turn-helix domain-containing protein n=1 Tax=Shouchella clausii TaxID=79880 RepID=UPI0026F4132F|nr:helix-turn-helix transcriptional regulator [Shouchella clausii]MDO7281757.1 helix-turn-helix transcriptional regulator [Shouchella clausii]MDO7301852.1 helix-turn-helix transcriptional regulator [Shouchella clausii]